MKISARVSFLIGFILIALFIGTSFFLEAFEGMNPCPLCILQRIDMALLGIIFFFGVICQKRCFIAIFASAMALMGILLAGRQVWLQHLPAGQNGDCGVSLQYLLHVLPIDQVISRIFQGTAECSQTGWQFLSLSLAEWSLLAFIGFFIFSIRQAWNACRT